MESTSILIERTKKMGNPFKFLDAYIKSEADSFFGRTKETRALIKSLQKSYVVVLYGPSGSGKSSMINCGLLNKLIINEDKIFEIRRRNIGIISTIAQVLHRAIQKKGQDSYIERFIEQFEEINASLRTSKLGIAQANEAIDKLDREMVSKKAAYQNEEITREAYKELVIENEKKLAKKEQLAIQNKAIKADKEKEFKGFFTQFLSYFNSPPVFIFDQFEELFTNGQAKEVEELGIFLQLVYNNHFPIKTLLSLREEYFSKLSLLESYLPQILYRRCLIDNPNEETVKLILTKSFERFNINQLGEEKEQVATERIDKIILKLGDDDSQRNRFYLPFLQIYMYKLYEEDYKRTYPNGIKETTPVNEHGYPPIELLEREINNFGDIKAILKRYIIDIDRSLQNELGTLTRTEASGNTVIRFLREFAHSEHTKRRVKIKQSEIGENQKKFELADITILGGLRKAIGENISANQINTILTALIDHRLLKPTSDNYLELSHDILARVINEFPIKESNSELLAARFNNCYKIYKNNECQDSDYLDDRTIEVLKANDLIDYILSNTQSEQNEKKGYWEKSLALSIQKRRKQIQAKDRQISKLRTLSLLILVALLLALVGLALFGVAQFKNNHNKEVIEHQKKEGEITGKVYEGTATAFNDVKVDRTAAIKKIGESEGMYDSAIGGLLKKLDVTESEWYKKMKDFLGLSNPAVTSKKPSLIDDLKNDLYINLNNYPFYSQQIILGEKDKSPIIYTKYLNYPSNPDSVIIFLLTDNKVLYKAITDYTIGQEKPINYEQVAADISAFEPYWDRDNQLTMLLVQEDKLYRKRAKQEEWERLEDAFVAIEDAKFLAKYKNGFVTNYKNNIVEFTIDKNGKLSRMNPILDNAKEIESFQQLGQDNYLVVFEKDYYFIRNEGGGVKRLDKRIQHKHEDGIASMDRIVVDGKYHWLLGSYDRTASLWRGKKEKKRLVGHGDKILKSSYLDRENGDFVMTSSADGTIKIWNLKTYEKEKIKVKEANTIEQLKYDSINSRLYVGFKYNKRKPDGYMVSYGDSLNLNHKDKHYQQKKEKDNEGHITSFDFGLDSLLLVGGYENKIVASTSIPNKVRIRRTGKGSGGSYPTITAIASKDSTMAMATKNGLYYFRDYFKDPVSKENEYRPLDTLKGQNFNSVDFHPTKPLILATAENSNIYLWNIEDKSITTIPNHLDKVRDAEFSEDGNWIISGSWDNTAILWKWDGNQYIKEQSFLTHTNDIEDVEFYGNNLFLTASSDYTVRIFERPNENSAFQPIPSLIRHDHKITTATFSGDGKYIYTGDNSGVIKKWEFRAFEADIKERLGILK